MAPRFFFGPARWLQPNSGLTAHERLVLAVLCQWTNRTTGECFPSVASIAAHAALSESSVHRAIAGLAKAGAVILRPRWKANGQSDSTVYFVLGFDPTPTELSGGGCQQDTPEGVRKGKKGVSVGHHNSSTDNSLFSSLETAELPTELSGRPPRSASEWQRLADAGELS